MAIKQKRRSWLVIVLIIAGIGFAALAALAVGYRLVTGKPLGLRSFVRDQIYYATSQVKALQNSQQIKSTSTGEFTNIIFLHQSVGFGLIEQGNLRGLLAERGYSFWDHGYNWEGLRGPDGKSLGYTIRVPNDNTDPDGLSKLFAQKIYDQPYNAFSGLMQHEVIILKSCYTANNLTEQAMVDSYQGYYRQMRDVMAQHPEKLFIVLTSPPSNPAETTPEVAARNQEMAAWIMSEEFTGGQNNIRTFDLYSQLAETDQSQPDANTLRAGYRTGSDSHPTETGNKAVAPLLADFIDQSIIEYRQQYANQN